MGATRDRTPDRSPDRDRNPDRHPHRQSWRRRLATAAATRDRAYRSRSLGWRLLAPAVFALAGVLFVTSMVSSQGTDLRAGRYDDLDGLANSQARELADIRARASDLTAEVDRLSREVGSAGDDPEQRRVEQLAGPAGLEPVSGPGVTITLDDAPDDAIEATTGDVSELLVHQQDIQAVVNALWAGGAEAMTIQGQRVIATTGIKCVGNTVVLHGVPYSPPYRISAIGPTQTMLSTVAASPYIQFYLEIVRQSGLGWDVESNRLLHLPGYEGATDLEFARPATTAARG
jgi:uncharacterized protein YlxW (UPF0749 family)